MSDGFPEESGSAQPMPKHNKTPNNRSGFVAHDNTDLIAVCRRLGITGPLEPLVHELSTGRAPPPESHAQKLVHQRHHSQSHGQHQHRKTTQSRSERKSSSASRAATTQQHAVTHQYLDESSAGKGTYGQESWGRDSGARDLSPAEPSGRHPMGSRAAVEMDAGMGCEGNQTTSSMIHLANKLQVAALSALKTDVLDLTARLQNTERERDSMHRKMVDAIEEKERAQRRLESIGSAHEARITEMHCVIVELNRKLKTRQDHAIMEEHEPEGSVSDLSFQDGSVYNSEMECTNADQESPTEPLDVKLVQPIPRSCESPASLPPPGNIQIQVQAMNEEILHLRGQVALLQSQLASQRDEEQHDVEPVPDDQSAADLDHPPRSPHDRSAYTSDDLCETAEIFEIPSTVAMGANTTATTEDIEFVRNATTSKLARQHRSDLNLPQLAAVNLATLSPNHKNDKPPVAKMAERVRLRRTVDPTSPSHISSALCSTEMAEHLVADMLQSDPESSTDTHRLHKRIEHVRLQNQILALTLAESRSHTNRLYLLCGKYESNAVALHQALCCSDRAVEAYDVMLALLESRLAILEAAGKQNGDATPVDAQPCLESRRAAEAVAQHLLARLDSNDKNSWLGNSLGPWNEAFVLPGSGDADKPKPWTDADDRRLRAAVSKLKGYRASIQNTVVHLEAPFSDSDTERAQLAAAGASAPSAESRRQELEAAVLMQELMSMREELTDSKQRTEAAIRDRCATIERATVMQEALLQLQSQLADTEHMLALSNNKKDRSSFTEAEHTACIERELVEALARESRLKARLQGLAGSVEAATKSSEEKYLQVQHTVSELKQTNLSLTQSLDRCRRKYQTRLRRLEQQMMELTVQQKTSTATNGHPASAAVPETTL